MQFCSFPPVPPFSISFNCSPSSLISLPICCFGLFGFFPKLPLQIQRQTKIPLFYSSLQQPSPLPSPLPASHDPGAVSPVLMWESLAFTAACFANPATASAADMLESLVFSATCFCWFCCP
ncbi:hypothetical protein HPP92_008456 [Vanilla planifolia]|uniref:Uncharacterized protein n=1 Tax=Vanilla planifolia TaxID=51239 RepID=A0A835RBZ8_VANPL|nr:hypothetical protein HPP92_008456 [Vanilla planifolia]